MGLGLGINGVIGGASQGVTIGSAIPGLGTAAGGIIGGGLGLLGGLFGSGNSTKQQKELMDKAWEYEKEGMGMQYQYGQMAANEAQRAEMEDAGLSVGLMYGNGGGQAASTAGGNATQPNGPNTNPVEVALQQQSLGLQLKQIEAQNRLANAEATKNIAEANKIAGVDTEGARIAE